MLHTNYSLYVTEGYATVNGFYLVPGVNMSALPADLRAIVWDNALYEGSLQYVTDPVTGITPPNTVITSPTAVVNFLTEIAEVDDILSAILSPVSYYFTEPTLYDGTQYSFAELYLSTEVGHPAPPNTTTLVPPDFSPGQNLYWDGSAWVVSSFDITLSLAAAKSSLIAKTQQQAAEASNTQISKYSTVQQINATPSVDSLETLDYPGTLMGAYQSYVDSVVSSAVSTINAATSTSDLYSFNPESQPFTPSATGEIFTGRGDGGSDLDMIISYYTTWTSSTVVESDTELFVPGTSTVIPYGSGGAGKFDSTGDCFVLGDYLVQIRQTSTGFVLAEFECPLNASGENVSF